MLELFLIIRLCHRNAYNACVRGRSEVIARVYTIVLWIFFEGTGIIVGAAIFRSGHDVKLLPSYLIGLAFAIFSGVISSSIAKRGKSKIHL